MALKGDTYSKIHFSKRHILCSYKPEPEIWRVWLIRSEKKAERNWLLELRIRAINIELGENLAL